jgi:hypothetical protein
MGDASHSARDPRKLGLFRPRRVPDGHAGGVGTGDRIYRDPWGTPYVITIDLSGDDRCVDAFYKNRGNGERVGLVKNAAGLHELSGGVMVWSLGPDRRLNDMADADALENKDNVLGWALK